MGEPLNHHLVVDLIHLVGRLFYRDEYVVVLDALAMEPLRDDGLHDRFGLHERQVRKILQDLERESLVWREKVSERLGRSGGARGELDIAAIAAELLADDGTSKGDGGKRKRPETGDTSSEEDDSDGSSSSSEEEDEKTKKAREKGKGGLRYGGSKYGGPAAKRKPPADGGGGGAAAAAAAPPKPRKPKRKIKAVLWYINPRYFVDVVRYRVYLLRRFLERLEQFEGNEAMYRCGTTTCRYECSLIEATQRLNATRSMAAAQARAAGSGVGGVGTPAAIMAMMGASAAIGGAIMRPGAGAAGAGPDGYAFTCPLCGKPLLAKRVDRIASTAARLLSRFTEQVKGSGLEDLVQRLDHVALGANRPSELIHSKRISLFGDPTQDIEALAAEGLLGGAAAGALTGSTGSGGTGGDAVMQGLRAAADMARTGVASAVAVPRVYLSGAGNAPRWGAGSSASSYASGVGGSGMGSGGSASTGGAGGGGGGIRRSAPTSSAIPAAAPAAPITVSAAALPAHLQRSSVTGQATQYLGFLQVGSGSSSGSAAGGSAAAAAAGAAAFDSGRLSPEAAEAAAAVAAALAGDASRQGVSGADADGGGGDDAAVWESLFAQLAETGNEADALATILDDGTADAAPPIAAGAEGAAESAAPMSLQASLASDDMSLGSLFRNEALLASAAGEGAAPAPLGDGSGAAAAGGAEEEEEWEDI